MVAAAHPLAAAAGARILGNGGNAFDAAAATAAALNVVEPYMSGLAGMGMATCYIASERRVRSLNFMSLIPRKFPLEKLSRREQIVRGPIAVGGTILLTKAYREAPPGAVTPLEYTALIWDALWGLVLFGEMPDAATIVGALVIIASGIFAVTRGAGRVRT